MKTKKKVSKSRKLKGGWPGSIQKTEVKELAGKTHKASGKILSSVFNPKPSAKSIAKRQEKYAREEAEIKAGKAAIKHYKGLQKVRKFKRQQKYETGVGKVLSGIVGTAAVRKERPHRRKKIGW